MGPWILLPIVGVTSLAGWWLGVRWLGLSAGGVAAAVLRMTELIGASVAFLALNVAIGIVVVLAIRVMTNQFVSAYVLDDISFLMLSTLQGLVFGIWRRCGRLSPR